MMMRQGMAALEQGLARRARHIISEWDRTSLLEALYGLDRLQRATQVCECKQASFAI